MLIDLKFDWDVINKTLEQLRKYDIEEAFIDGILAGNGWEKVYDGAYLSYILDEYNLEDYGVTNIKVTQTWKSFSQPENWRTNYGVCDNFEQVLATYPELITDERKFIVILSPILKKHEPEQGGWRWHKWGQYIGEQEPRCEYLYNEPVIEEVWLYDIYEVEEI